jgi:hypothetical protein
LTLDYGKPEVNWRNQAMSLVCAVRSPHQYAQTKAE